jgi:hypothetical protein
MEKEETSSTTEEELDQVNYGAIGAPPSKDASPTGEEENRLLQAKRGRSYLVD